MDKITMKGGETALNGALTKDYNVIILSHYPPNNAKYITCSFTSILDKASQSQYNVLSELVQEKVKAFMDNGGKFVCYLSGHTHIDLVMYNNNYPKQLFLVIDTASINSYWSNTNRAIDTNAENLFNLFSFDPVHNYVKVVRVGANVDDTMRRKDLLCVNYKTMEVIANS